MKMGANALERGQTPFSEKTRWRKQTKWKGGGKRNGIPP